MRIGDKRLCKRNLSGGEPASGGADGFALTGHSTSLLNVLRAHTCVPGGTRDDDEADEQGGAAVRIFRGVRVSGCWRAFRKPEQPRARADGAAWNFVWVWVVCTYIRT